MSFCGGAGEVVIVRLWDLAVPEADTEREARGDIAPQLDGRFQALSLYGDGRVTT